MKDKRGDKAKENWLNCKACQTTWVQSVPQFSLMAMEFYCTTTLFTCFPQPPPSDITIKIYINNITDIGWIGRV